MPVSFQELSNFIWSVADLLRGPYRPPQYERVMFHDRAASLRRCAGTNERGGHKTLEYIERRKGK